MVRYREWDEWAHTSYLVSAQLQASTTYDTLEHHDSMLSACRALQAVLLSDLPRTEGHSLLRVAFDFLECSEDE